MIASGVSNFLLPKPQTLMNQSSIKTREHLASRSAPAEMRALAVGESVRFNRSNSSRLAASAERASNEVQDNDKWKSCILLRARLTTLNTWEGIKRGRARVKGKITDTSYMTMRVNQEKRIGLTMLLSDLFITNRRALTVHTRALSRNHLALSLPGGGALVGEGGFSPPPHAQKPLLSLNRKSMSAQLLGLFFSTHLY